MHSTPNSGNNPSNISLLKSVIAAAKITTYSGYVSAVKEFETKHPRVSSLISSQITRKLDEKFDLNLRNENAKEQLKTTKYEQYYPPMAEFERPWDVCNTVPRGGAKISSDGIPLQSEKFTQCIALLVKDGKSGCCALFHIQELDLEWEQNSILHEFMSQYVNRTDIPEAKKSMTLKALDLVCHYDSPHNIMSREEFASVMGGLNDDGRLKARFAYGSIGRQTTSYRVYDSMLKYLGIRLDSDIYVDSERWGIVYSPADSIIYVDSRGPKELIQYSW
jgi:hypothetical protein